ncbi:MAG: hypothetical protein M0R75_12800 [Dehalococcoidia bacterium]|nr:hypothetical protein [Dehalococcoidia bacterium]
MAASSQSMSITAPIQATAIAVRRPLPLVIAQRAMPLVTASAGVALATLAAERALASLALRAAERAGLRIASPVASIEPAITRVTVTHTTVVERITTRRS